MSMVIHTGSLKYTLKYMDSVYICISGIPIQYNRDYAEPLKCVYYTLGDNNLSVKSLMQAALQALRSDCGYLV